MSKTKKFVVQIPITGAVSIEIEARDKKEAKALAWKYIDDGHEPHDCTWEYTETVAEGNVCSAFLNEVSVIELKDQ